MEAGKNKQASKELILDNSTMKRKQEITPE